MPRPGSSSPGSLGLGAAAREHRHPPPLQPANTEPASGVAVSVTGLFSGINTLHELLHEASSVLSVTLPAPVPAMSANVKVGATSNFASTFLAALMVTVQVGAAPLPPPPLQPVNFA